MSILIYLCIIIASVTRSATSKLYNRSDGPSYVFNAIKTLSALILFILMGIVQFRFHLPTVLYGAAYGAFLCIASYSGFRALSMGPMSLTSMLVSFSLIIPLVWGIAVRGEQVSLIQYVGILLLMVALVLVNADKLRRGGSDGKINRLWFLYVAITFACDGACSILQKEHQTQFPSQYSKEFMFFAMLLCSAVFVISAFRKMTFSEIKAVKGKKFAVLSGVTNAVQNYLTMILAGFENATALFPIISAGTVLGSLACGGIAFKEKLKINQYLAIALGIAAVVLLKI